MPRILSLFPLWAISLSGVAYFYAHFFASLKPAIIPLLGLVMFAMGMTLTWKHFRVALKQPLIIAITVTVQFVLMPLFAWLIAHAFELTTQQLIGMVLVGCSSGGTASNVICYLARGNVALSVLMTMTSTLCAVFLMPTLSFVYLQQTIAVPVWEMMQSILLIVLIPVISGTAINSYYGGFLNRIQKFFPLVSSLSIVLIIAIIVALNHDNLNSLTMPLLLAVMLHNLLGLTAGYAIPWLMKYDAVTCRTVSIEVGMQNSGLSVALAIKYFSSMATLPGAIFSIWHNISGSLLATYWRNRR